VLVSCARSLRRAADAGNEQQIRPATGHTVPAPGQSSPPGTEPAGCRRRASWDLACTSARHGWLRRNAVSQYSVRLGGAPGAPLGGPSNRAPFAKLQRDGIVAVPRVFTQGVLLARCDPGKRASGSCPGTLRPLSIARGQMATHGGMQGVAAVSGPERAAVPGRQVPGDRESWKDH